MATATAAKEKYLIHCQDGANHIERATISLTIATSASNTSEAVVFMSSDASALCVKGGADKLHEKGYEPLADLINQFVKNGGKIWLCRACAKAKGIAEKDLIDGAEIAGAPDTMAFLAGGAKLLA